MVTRFKPLPKLGKTFAPRKKEGCNWCLHRTLPDVHGICDKCVEGFKRLLQSRQWRSVRQAKLYRNPECECGCGQLAQEVDHTEDWRYRPDLFWVTEYLQSLNYICHRQKTADTVVRMKKLQEIDKYKK